MNPNPKQPDAPFTVRSLPRKSNFDTAKHYEVKGFGCSVIVSSAYMSEGSARDDLPQIVAERLALIGNVTTALHAAGWDAARVFERLPEALRLAELCVRTQENIESLWNSENSPSIRALADKEGERVDAIAALKSFLAQLKLKRDTAGGGR